MDYLTTLLFLCPILFMAGFVDAVSGGGGLLSLPAFIFTGMPIHSAYGCNKVSCGISTCMSSYRYFKNGMIDKKVALTTGAVVFVCSLCASRIVLSLPEKPLKIMVLASMPFVALLILVSKNYPEENHSSELSTKKRVLACVLTGVLMGFYDGLLGPGSGTLAIILYTKFFRYDLKTASGNAKIAVLASMLASSFSYIFAGKVIWSVAIPVALCGTLGGYLGAGMAIKKGARFIRPMMLFIAALLIIKMAIDMLEIL